MIVVTGSEGFIGKVLIKKLRALNYKVIGLDIKINTIPEMMGLITTLDDISFIFHLGAISNTREKSKAKFNKYNINFTTMLSLLTIHKNIPMLVASSAATYGDGDLGYDDNIHPDHLKPLNLYAHSKNDIDRWLITKMGLSKFWIVKFFNVYGHDESHKGEMASMVYHSYNQIKDRGYVELFKSYLEFCDDGEQKRDFVYVNDVVDVCVNIMEKKPECDIYNIGTGRAESFNNLILSVFKALNLEPDIRYVEMPDDLKDKYQYHTEANINKLKSVGCDVKFHDLESGVFEYIKNIENDKNC